MYVHATIACRADDLVVALLKARSNRGHFKWTDVRSFVRATDSLEAIRVREKLGEATITVVDPAAYLRTEEVPVGSVRHLVPALSRQVMKDPELRWVRQLMTRSIGRRILVSSGAESAYGLLTTPMHEDLPLYPSGEHASPSSDLDPLRLVERMPDLNKLSRIAVQSTALMGHEHDPAFFDEIAATMRRFRFWDESRYNQARLEALARRSVVFDRGHETETEFAMRLHHAAVGRVERFTPFRTGLITAPGHGEVRLDSTPSSSELQVADVAAGWAKDILQGRGALELCKQFRIVIYNGMTLHREQASRLDDERRFSRRAVSRL